MIALNVDGIFSNHPENAARIVAEILQTNSQQL
jgi:hypothetical protein